MIQQCHVLNEGSEADFQNQANSLMEDGWELQSSSCGYVPDPYDCNFFMGIFIKKENKL